MGMLMHHTWLKQQKEKEQAEKPDVPAEKAETENESEETGNEPTRKTGGRRKAIK